MIDGVPVTVARQGFTGELGFELWVERPGGERVWEAVAAAGAPFGIQPAGEYAIDIARVEAGLILISADYTGAGPDAPSADTAPQPGGLRDALRTRPRALREAGQGRRLHGGAMLWPPSTAGGRPGVSWA